MQEQKLRDLVEAWRTMADEHEAEPTYDTSGGE